MGGGRDLVVGIGGDGFVGITGYCLRIAIAL